MKKQQIKVIKFVENYGFLIQVKDLSLVEQIINFLHKDDLGYRFINIINIGNYISVIPNSRLRVKSSLDDIIEKFG